MISLQMAILAVAVSGTGETALLDFYSDSCGPCRRMAPVVQQLSLDGYPVRKVNVDQDRALASRFNVRGIPCFVLLVDGREVARRVGVVEGQQLKALFQTAGYAPAVIPSSPRQTAGVDTFNTPVAMSSVQVQDPLLAPPETMRPNHRVGSVTAPRRGTPRNSYPNSPAPGAAVAQRTSRPGGESFSSTKPTILESQLIAVTARIKVADATGHSYGTGTLIHARGDEVLILTCGHIFRDSKGKGPISVDLFAPGAPQGVPARLIRYDLKSDIGLISIRPGVALKTARVAAKGYKFEKGTPVVNVGCNHGDPATARRSKITSINKYLGPPNVQVAGLPVEGRSGGGLFTLDGQVIGVCNAADPADNEGLYAALDTIHAELDGARLSFVHQETPDDARMVAVASNGVPTMPQEMPVFPEQTQPTNARSTLVPLSGVPSETTAAQRDLATTAPLQPAGNLDVGATSSDLLRRGEEAEVICVVRSLSDPTAKSVVIKIDRAAPEFLEQLAALRNGNRSPNGPLPTSLRSEVVTQAAAARDIRNPSGQLATTTARLSFQFPWRRAAGTQTN